MCPVELSEFDQKRGRVIYGQFCEAPSTPQFFQFIPNLFQLVEGYKKKFKFCKKKKKTRISNADLHKFPILFAFYGRRANKYQR